MSRDPAAAANEAAGLCDDCPPAGYPTHGTRCVPCPRRELRADPAVEHKPYKYQAIFDAILAGVHVDAAGCIHVSVQDFIQAFAGHRDRDLASDALLCGPQMTAILIDLDRKKLAAINETMRTEQK